MPKRIINEVVRVNGVVKALRGKPWGERSKEQVIEDIEKRGYVYQVDGGEELTVVHPKWPRRPYLRTRPDYVEDSKVRAPLELDNLRLLPRRPKLRIYGETKFKEAEPVHLGAEARDVTGYLATDEVEWTWNGRQKTGSNFDTKLPKGWHMIAASLTYGGLTARDQFRVEVA